MLPIRFSALLVALFAMAYSVYPQSSSRPARPVLVVHGGAGVITRANMTPEREAQVRATLEEAMRKGYAILEAGGTALDAVTVTVRHLEDSGVFNTGKGAVRTTEGRAELDASIMDGKTGMAGAVAGLTTVRNPILAARYVMERTPHVLLIGKGAEIFAAEQGIDVVGPDYFQERPTGVAPQAPLRPGETRQESKHGTVGCVAVDQQGNLAAATSTGGMSRKLPGRVGDSPVIGAGTYADNATCAVSATGHGEFFIREVLAYDIAARMKYRSQTLAQAARDVIAAMGAKGGTGGIIAVDAQGNITMPFNTEGMYRGFIRNGEVKIEIYR